MENATAWELYRKLKELDQEGKNAVKKLIDKMLKNQKK